MGRCSMFKWEKMRLTREWDAEIVEELEESMILPTDMVFIRSEVLVVGRVVCGTEKCLL